MHKREDISAHISASQQKDKGERLTCGVGATRLNAFRGVVVAKALDNFHMCIWREPTSTSINRPLLHPPQHTHTHTHFISLIPRILSLSLALY